MSSRNSENITEIRNSTYGLDARTPIADSLQGSFDYANDELSQAVTYINELETLVGVKRIQGTDEDYVMRFDGNYNTAWDIFSDGYGKGNINLNTRSVVHNSDGSISTEQSFSSGFLKSELQNVISSTELNKISASIVQILLPTVINGQIYSEDNATLYFFQHGEYLGLFETVAEAEEYAELLHERQEWYYGQ